MAIGTLGTSEGGRHDEVEDVDGLQDYLDGGAAHYVEPGNAYRAPLPGEYKSLMHLTSLIKDGVSPETGAWRDACLAEDGVDGADIGERLATMGDQVHRRVFPRSVRDTTAVIGFTLAHPRDEVPRTSGVIVEPDCLRDLRVRDQEQDNSKTVVRDLLQMAKKWMAIVSRGLTKNSPLEERLQIVTARSKVMTIAAQSGIEKGHPRYDRLVAAIDNIFREELYFGDESELAS
jgi:hypothetical protein